MLTFYLDDYKLIRFDNFEQISNSEIKVYINDEEVFLNTAIIDDHFCLYLNEDYSEDLNINIFVDDKECELVPRFITHTSKFDEEYKVDVKTLGSFVSFNKTTFRLYAPLAKEAVVVIDGHKKKMVYLGKGIYEHSERWNLEKHTYHYEVLRDKWYSFSDPFSYNDKNDDESYVIDVNKLRKEKVIPCENKALCIYETSVRDFSSEGHYFKYPKKFLGLTEDNLSLDGKPIGLAYLKELGISHVQLMPVFSFDLDKSEYNWGYNPKSYNVLERSYFVSSDPYKQIAEFKEMVNTLHKNDLKVNLDVVFNHVYKAQKFSLGKMLPYYPYRYVDTKMANGTYCGSEIRSEAPFMREYLKLMCERYIEIFDIDGLRFDLMGILDYQTINEIKDVCTSLKKDFLVYGEGWDMGDVLDTSFRAKKENAPLMKDVAFFNDSFRELLRGSNIDDFSGFIFGDESKKDKVKDALNHSASLGYEVNQSINYVECHDNYTIFDKIDKLEISDTEKIQMAKFALGLVVLSKGLPFVHSGEEFLRTKKGIDNSYNLPDSVNALSWARKNEYLEVVDYFKNLLKVKNKVINYYSKDMEISDFYEMLVARMGELAIFINPTAYEYYYEDEHEYLILLDENGDNMEIKCKGFHIGSRGIKIAIQK